MKKINLLLCLLLALLPGLAYAEGPTGTVYSSSFWTGRNHFLVPVTAPSLTSTFIELTEAAEPSTPTNAVRLSASTSNHLCWLGESGFGGCLNSTSNTATRIIATPNAAGTLALESGMPIANTTLTGTMWREVTACTYVSNTGTANTLLVTEEVIGTPCAIPANTLTRDGISKIRVLVKWWKAATVTSATGRIRWGAAGAGIGGQLMATTVSTASDVGISMQATGSRITSSTQRMSSDFQLANTASQTQTATPGTLDLTAATEIAVTMAGTAVGDGRVYEVSVQVLN